MYFLILDRQSLDKIFNRAQERFGRFGKLLAQRNESLAFLEALNKVKIYLERRWIETAACQDKIGGASFQQAQVLPVSLIIISLKIAFYRFN